MKIKEQNILIAISALRKIMEIFFGPFLISYFIKKSIESLVYLSVYNIISYIVLGIFGFVVGYIVKNKFQVGMFRIGVILNFVYILAIILLKEKFIEYIWLIALLYGFSAIIYYYPYNLFIARRVKNNNRANYEIKRKSISLLVSVLTPILLGSLISTTNFQLTAILIAIISVIQIILSFFIKPEENKNYNYTIKNSFKVLWNDKETRNMFKVDFFKGMNVSSGALEVIITILILNAFKTDMNLGIITSLSSLATIIFIYMYRKLIKEKNDKKVIVFCSIVPVICLIILMIYKSNFTLILYYMLYTVLINIIAFIIEVRLFNLSNSDLIKKDHHMEFWAIREAVLDLGRVIGYCLMLIFALSNISLYHLMIILTVTIFFMSYYLTKIGRHEE